jgi:hypothetical protein
MTAVLFKHQRQLAADEFRTRNAPLPGGAREQSVVLRIERDGRGLHSRQCHDSNMTANRSSGQPACHCGSAHRSIRLAGSKEPAMRTTLLTLSLAMLTLAASAQQPTPVRLPATEPAPALSELKSV